MSRGIYQRPEQLMFEWLDVDKTILKEGIRPINSSLILYVKCLKLYYNVEVLNETNETSVCGFCFGVNNINIEKERRLWNHD